MSDLVTARLWVTRAAPLPADIRDMVQAIRAALVQGECELGNAVLALVQARDDATAHKALLADLGERLILKAAHDARIAGRQAVQDQDFAAARDHFSRLATLVPNHPWADRLLRWTTGLAPDFAARLAAELPHVRCRAFITGCGRSGTWMLAAMMGGLSDTRMLPGERPLGDFLWMPDEDAIHVLKRQHDAYRYFDRIPADISVIHMVRHPWAVLASQHKEVQNYISRDRIEGEHHAYLTHLADRPNTLVLRYEDLVRAPEATQSQIEALLKTTAAWPFAEFWRNTVLDPAIVSAMHGLRPLDPASVDAWRRADSLRGYLRDTGAQDSTVIGDMAERFGYDLEIP